MKLGPQLEHRFIDHTILWFETLNLWLYLTKRNGNQKSHFRKVSFTLLIQLNFQEFAAVPGKANPPFGRFAITAHAKDFFHQPISHFLSHLGQVIAELSSLRSIFGLVEKCVQGEIVVSRDGKLFQGLRKKRTFRFFLVGNGGQFFQTQLDVPKKKFVKL